MPNELPLPDDFQHLIEKRGKDEDRRLNTRRRRKSRRLLDTGPGGALESADDVDDVPVKDRRKSQRRALRDKRRRKRRTQDRDGA